ncbi:MAG: transcription termination/antitermination protein NusG [Nitrospinae bacterium]|nr:transcription termination/antitermination protein NusG [Nitrospinota bacterium]
MNKKTWYVIHTYSGYESKVKANIEERVKEKGMENKISQVIIPTEDVVEVSGGKKRISERKFYPGYVFVEMEMDEETWYFIKNIPKVTGFLGGHNEPTPVTEAEIKDLMEQMKGGDTSKPRPKYSFLQGENVRVVEGPFNNFVGVVEEVNSERGKVKIMVNIFGRATPLELEFSQIEKV